MIIDCDTVSNLIKLSSTGVSIRNFVKADVAPCVKIIGQTLGRSSAIKARKTLLEGLEPKTHEYVFLKRQVAVSKNKVIALTGIYRYDTHPDKTVGIGWFAVMKKYQKRGIGKKLIELTIKEARKHKNHLLFVWATKKAEPFYKKFGFKRSRMKIRPAETKILLTKAL